MGGRDIIIQIFSSFFLRFLNKSMKIKADSHFVFFQFMGFVVVASTFVAIPYIDLKHHSENKGEK
jgi:hypothetical protein